MTLNEICIKKTFTVAGIEFIKVACEGDRTGVMAKDPLFRARFGKDNNFANSELLQKLQTEVLAKIEAEIGAENVLEFETDLTSLDGLKTHGKMVSRISLPTFDFYRENVELFDEYKLDDWWWLATPETTEEHLNNDWVICVSPRGNFFCNRRSRNLNSGVRPVLIFESNISVS